MPKSIGRLITPLLHLLFPPTGRRRARACPSPTGEDAPTMPLPRAVRPAPRLLATLADEMPLVRPYVLSAEERRERRLQRERRRSLWLAAHGIDSGPRLIHGVEVAR
ncbi:hypothetical protein [Streptomyces aidingensis]|uniref:Uncharacterized protein n=1 Tax=Streptomyces aidingensis TaxID=910347 RepID=A0A1I1QGZ0_9ACTN|nr:hypothetical protein [Streptomyces aidingensis]SFD21325.1 hypothetical protein SAMN05421773_111103 [Streptomyces aidingensis]